MYRENTSRKNESKGYRTGRAWNPAKTSVWVRNPDDSPTQAFKKEQNAKHLENASWSEKKKKTEKKWADPQSRTETRSLEDQTSKVALALSALWTCWHWGSTEWQGDGRWIQDWGEGLGRVTLQSRARRRLAGRRLARLRLTRWRLARRVNGKLKWGRNRQGNFAGFGFGTWRWTCFLDSDHWAALIQHHGCNSMWAPNSFYIKHRVAEVAIHSGEMQVQAAKIGMGEVSKKQVVHGQNSQHRSRECGSVKECLTVMQETLGLAASTEKNSQNK